MALLKCTNCESIEVWMLKSYPQTLNVIKETLGTVTSQSYFMVFFFFFFLTNTTKNRKIPFFLRILLFFKNYGGDT